MNKQIPMFVMLVGLPGSGKSTYAESLSKHYKIHSSDALRETLFGDVNKNSKESNDKLFYELHKQIKSDLRKGKNVVYDATNLNRKRRMAFLREIKSINCYKKCVLVAAPYYVCLTHNQIRERHVPEEVIKRMYMNFQPPHKSEGWDNVDIVFSCEEGDFSDYTLSVLYNHATGIDYMNQCNKHHKLTLGEHCKKAARYIASHYPKNRHLYIAALLHDEGKIFTRTEVNSKGIKDGNCHYYQHNCVGAYDSIFYTYNLYSYGEYNSDLAMDIATIIYFHMSPYNDWNFKTEEKMKQQLGEKLFNEIIALHEADKFAH